MSNIEVRNQITQWLVTYRQSEHLAGNGLRTI